MKKDRFCRSAASAAAGVVVLFSMIATPLAAAVDSRKEETPLRGAKWLCPQQLVHATNTVVEFTSEFDSGAEVPVSFAVSADTAYAAELNGRMFHCGSFPDTPPRRFYDLMPAGRLREGKNELKVKLYIEGIDTFRHIPGDPGVMFSLFGDGVHVKSGTSTRWRVSAQDRIEGVACVTRQLGFSFDHDASASGNPWRDITDADARRDDRDFILEQRPVPKTEILGPIESRIVAQGVLDGSQTPDSPAIGMDETPMMPVGKEWFFQDDARSVRKEMFGKGFYVTVDLGREEAGHLMMELDTDEGVTVDIGHAEHMKDGRITVSLGNRGFAGRYRTKEGRQSFFRWRQRIAGRYIQIHVRGVRTRFRLERLTVCPAMLPLAEKPAPEGLDPLQKRIWDVSVRTLRLCAHEHYEDCPWREQALYANDSRNQMLAGYHAFGADNRMPELSMELMARGLGEDGWMELCMPARIPITIPSFTFSWVLSVDDHFKYRKDKIFTRAMMPVVKRILDRRLREMKDGLLPDPAGKRYWHFYEWAEDLDGGDVCGFTVKPGEKCFDSPLNLLFLLALEAGARCDEAVGDGSDARLWRSVAGRLRTEIRRRFWNAGKRRMETRLGADLKPAELVHSLALLADAVPPEDKSFVAERLASGSDWTETTISQALYKFEALAAFGGAPAKSIIPKISSEWGAMLEKGATSFWEMREGASAFHDAGSLCHGWSAIPAYIYGAYPELRKCDADRARRQ